MMNGMNGMNGMSGAPPSLQHTPVLSRTLHLPSDSLLDKSRSPMILKNSMFLPNGHSQLQQQNNQRNLMGIATLDRKNLPRTRRGTKSCDMTVQHSDPEVFKIETLNTSGPHKFTQMIFRPRRRFPFLRLWFTFNAIVERKGLKLLIWVRLLSNT